MQRSIDINCDMGERPEALRDGSEEELMPLITSANIACGGHAGDSSTMEGTVILAVKYNVGIGAHPGYPDRANFGRVSMSLSTPELTRIVYEQIRSLGTSARAHHRELVHVKPHGALYHDATRSPAIAEAIAEGAAQWSKDVIFIGLAGALMLDVWQEKGFRVAPEAFADRSYESNGTLRSRELDGSLIIDPMAAARQAIKIVTEGIVLGNGGTGRIASAASLCVHSDTPGAIEILRAVRQELVKAGIGMQGLSLRSEISKDELGSR